MLVVYMRAITCSNTAVEERQLLIWKDKVMAPAADQWIGESFLELVVVEINLQEKKRKVLKQKEMRDFVAVETRGWLS